MNAKTTISISEARRRIFDIAEEVQKPNKYYTFTENGKPKAVMLSAEEFDSLMENLEMLEDPDLLKRIKESEEEYKRGEYVTLDELERELKYGASFVREKMKQYHVRRKTAARKKK